MSKGRRATILIALAVVLGGLAASSVAQRERSIARQIGPVVNVVVARHDLEAGQRLKREDLSLRPIPARFAPIGAATDVQDLSNGRLLVAVPKGGYLAAGQLDTAASKPLGSLLQRNERAVEIIATGSPDLVTAGSRLDVVVTKGRETVGSTKTDLALQNIEVLAARPIEAREDDHASRVAATLRVSVRQAVYLASAQAAAQNIRFLPRAANDNGQAGNFSVDGHSP